MSAAIDIVYFHPPQRGVGMLVGWMRFKSAKTKERAHVFKPVPGSPELMMSLCNRWHTRMYSQVSGIAILEAAADDRTRCKRCEKKWAELNGGSIQA